MRVLGSGQSTKTDPNDARSVAVAALHAPSLALVRPADHVTVCRLLAKHHSDVARWRTKLCCRLHALMAELVPGSTRPDGRTVRFIAGDYREVFRAFRAFANLSSIRD